MLVEVNTKLKKCIMKCFSVYTNSLNIIVNQQKMGSEGLVEGVGETR